MKLIKTCGLSIAVLGSAAAAQYIEFAPWVQECSDGMLVVIVLVGLALFGIAEVFED